MIHYDSLKMVLVAPQKVANSQRVSDLLFNCIPPGHHKSHHAHANALQYSMLCVSVQVYRVSGFSRWARKMSEYSVIFAK